MSLILRRGLTGLATLSGLLFTPAFAWALEETDAGAPADAAPQDVAQAQADAGAPIPSVIDERLARQQAQIDALLATTKEQARSLTSLREAQAAAASDEPPTKLLSFWGFSDLNFGKIFYDNPGALYKAATPSDATFFSTGVNLYAKSEMTRTLSAFLETRLTYTPNGYTNDQPFTATIGNTPIYSSTGTPPPNTTVHGPISQLQYRQDGLLIERAYMEWKPADWFGVRVGRFLTPFGIWNEDHGSPVLIGVDYPQFMNFNIVPIWQLGVEAFGSVPLGDELRVDYAATWANSHGPSDEYQDLTDMKALGARLKLVYTHGDNFSARLGGYAYYNEYVDSVQTIQAHLTPGLTLDNSASPPLSSGTQTSTAYHETVLTGDAEIRIQKFRLLGEIAHQTVIYTVPQPLGDLNKLLKGVPLGVDAYNPSHYGIGGYVLAAYEIPFHTKILDFSVMPYLGYDYVVPESTVPTTANTQLRAGLNVKPSPYVTIKVEYTRLLPKSDAVGGQASAIISQLAYSF